MSDTSHGAKPDAPVAPQARGDGALRLSLPGHGERLRLPHSAARGGWSTCRLLPGLSSANLAMALALPFMSLLAMPMPLIKSNT
eukprot:scaffold1228_cov115-Isochrysis_galbana.AAC.8